MTEINTGSNAGGIGFIGLLTIIFIVLKLLGKIDWSWWWILLPLWIGPIMFIIVLMIIIIIIRRQ